MENMKSLWWKQSMDIPGTSWNICGYSKSAYRTGFYISALDLMLDAGPQNFNKPSNIFITHSHIDHIACLPFTMIGEPGGNHIFNIYAPVESESFIRDYIKSMFSANESKIVDPTPWYKYHALLPTNSFRITNKKTIIDVEVFKCHHHVPTISYGLSEFRKKLKDEYSTLSGKEIGQLRKSGVEITNDTLFKTFAFVCDTTIQVFDTNPSILEYPVIMIECTYIHKEEFEMANKHDHIHWDQLKPYVEKYPKTTFILFHFSQRYSEQELADFFGNEVKSGLTNVKWWGMSKNT